MDLATIIGLVVGMGFVIGSCGSDVERFISEHAMMLVGGGGLCSVLVAYPLKDVLGSWRVMMQLFVHKTESPIQLIDRLVGFAEVARRDGILALEGVTSNLQDQFLVKGLQLAVDGTDPELIEDIMKKELHEIEERHEAGRRIFEIFTKYAPAWGLIGTLVGQILMLANLSEPEKIGPSMAIALVATLYGCIAANLITGPFGDKLLKRNKEELLIKQIVLKGVMAIQSGDNPRIVEQKLRVFLPPSQRKGKF